MNEEHHHHFLTQHFRRPRAVRVVMARPRLVGSTILGLILVVLFHTLTDWRLPTQLLIAWNLAIGLYLILAWTMMLTSGEGKMKLRAQIQDEGQSTVLLLTIVASVACMTAIIMQLSGLKDMTPLLRGLHVGLAVLTILTAWCFVHSMFALHYAHEFYAALVRGQPPCLEFPEECPRPGYTDFLYVSFVIGTSGQTADVSLASKSLRRIGLLHCVLAFFFNTTLLALTINIAAGLIS